MLNKFVVHFIQGTGGCKRGCRDSQNLMVQLDQLPAAPVSSDILLLISSVGSFLLDVRNTQPSNANAPSSVHSFAVRIEGVNITQYWWMVSIYCIAVCVKTLKEMLASV